MYYAFVCTTGTLGLVSVLHRTRGAHLKDQYCTPMLFILVLLCDHFRRCFSLQLPAGMRGMLQGGVLSGYYLGILTRLI